MPKIVTWQARQPQLQYSFIILLQWFVDFDLYEVTALIADYAVPATQLIQHTSKLLPVKAGDVLFLPHVKHSLVGGVLKLVTDVNRAYD